MIVEKFYSNNRLRSRRFLENNKLHRTDGPAFIQYYRNGQKKAEHWFTNNKYTIQEEPNYIEYLNNIVFKKEWRIGNLTRSKAHRKDKPAILQYSTCPPYNLRIEYWVENGQHHRENAPATIWYHENFKEETRHWVINDYRHRLDGPAVEDRNRKRFFLYGEELNEAEHRNLSKKSPEEILIHLIQTSLAKSFLLEKLREINPQAARSIEASLLLI